jgi:chemotaxis receptor (MCP) glutamine deamidase CheD
MQDKKLPQFTDSAQPRSRLEKSAFSGDNQRCQILAKKGFLSARGLSSSLAIIIYSRQFQLGVLLHLSAPGGADARRLPWAEDGFAKSAMAMILAEFGTLGVSKEELVTYAVGGATTEDQPPVTEVAIKRALWHLGLVPSACDVGGFQSRSVWLDVESGRIIVRSVSTKQAILGSPEAVCAVS